MADVDEEALAVEVDEDKDEKDADDDEGAVEADAGSALFNTRTISLLSDSTVSSDWRACDCDCVDVVFDERAEGAVVDGGTADACTRERL